MSSAEETTTVDDPKARTPAAVRHRSFSLSRIGTIAWNTLTELTRSKVFYFLFIFGLVLLGGSLLSVSFSFGEEFQMLKDVALGAIGIFSTLHAIMATAMLLPKDVEDRTLFTILAKPIPRSEYLLGKLAGVFGLLTISVCVMAVLFFALLAYREGVRLGELEGVFDNPEDLAAAQQSIRDAAFGPGLIPGIVLILVQAFVCASFTLLLSTFATSSLFTIMMSFAVLLIGHVQGIARKTWMDDATAGWLERAFAGVITLLFPDLQMLNVVDEVVAGESVSGGMFVQLLGLGLLYCTIYIIAMLAIFHSREL
ncbi:MAG: ABC transporter permease subunit [Verrucomicrobiia bacterium]